MTTDLKIAAFQLNATMYEGYYAQVFRTMTDKTTERFHIELPSLGKGGYGEVWKVAEIAGARRVRALKLVKKANELSINEVKSLIALNEYEQHFTRFYGSWKDEHNLYIVTELMEGGDLKGMIGGGPKYLPENQTKKIAKRILEATAIMHSRGIIHQDLKPGNILLANKDPQRLDIRIADMGISRAAGSLSDARAAPTTKQGGTWGYMAPEVVKYTRRRSVEEKYGPNASEEEKKSVKEEHEGLHQAITVMADIWSVGCVVFAMLTGHSPSPGHKLLNDDGDFPTETLQYNEVSVLGIEFIKKLVKVRRQDRMTALQALDDRWLLGA